jgi:ATP-dependent DNA helicase RecQ
VLADWGWDERPVAVISMPSRSRPQLVASIAEALASAGKLPYLGSLSHTGGGPTGEPGGNSAYRLASVWGQFEWAGGDTGAGTAAAEDAPLPNGPILLVDDLVDSRWTLTIAAKALREAGADSVLPFALALRG